MTQLFFENSATAINDFNEKLILRDYHEEVISTVYKFFEAGKKRILVYAPTIKSRALWVQRRWAWIANK